jgi:hypothetical protein
MGTIFVELVMRRPFLVAETDMGQLKRMFEVLGTPDPEEWPVSETHEYKQENTARSC